MDGANGRRCPRGRPATAGQHRSLECIIPSGLCILELCGALDPFGVWSVRRRGGFEAAEAELGTLGSGAGPVIGVRRPDDNCRIPEGPPRATHEIALGGEARSRSRSHLGNAVSGRPRPDRHEPARLADHRPIESLIERDLRARRARSSPPCGRATASTAAGPIAASARPRGGQIGRAHV